jgi:hypothetical protein
MTHILNIHQIYICTHDMYAYVHVIDETNKK